MALGIHAALSPYIIITEYVVFMDVIESDTFGGVGVKIIIDTNMILC